MKTHLSFLSTVARFARCGIWLVLTLSKTRITAFLIEGINKPNIALGPVTALWWYKNIRLIDPSSLYEKTKLFHIQNNLSNLCNKPYQINLNVLVNTTCYPFYLNILITLVLYESVTFHEFYSNFFFFNICFSPPSINIWVIFLRYDTASHPYDTGTYMHRYRDLYRDLCPCKVGFMLKLCATFNAKSKYTVLFLFMISSTEKNIMM